MKTSSHGKNDGYSYLQTLLLLIVILTLSGSIVLMVSSIKKQIAQGWNKVSDIINIENEYEQKDIQNEK